jgi:predicted lactoylglutathione lyase
VDQRTVELRVVDQFRAETPQEAERVYSAWLKSKDLPDDTANYGYRKNEQAADDQRDSVAIQRRLGVQDVDTDVAQNFEPRRQNYELVSDEDPDRVLHRMNNATADEVRAWIAQQEAGGMPTGFLRTRIVAESMESQQDQTALDRAAQKLKFQDWADAQQRGSEYAIKAIQEIVRRTQSDAQPAPARSAIGQAINQAELDALTQQIQIARRLGDDVNEGQVITMPANTAKARALTQTWITTYRDADIEPSDKKKRLDGLRGELANLGWSLVTKKNYGPVLKHISTGAMIPLDRIMENFADGKVKGKSRPGRVKRAGASCKGSVTSLRQKAKNTGGERARMYHWCANMKSGKKK